MASPLLLLKSLAVETEESRQQKQNTIFTPKVLNSLELFNDIQLNKDRFQSNNLVLTAVEYMYAIAKLRDDAYQYLAMIFEYKAFLVKTLIETAIYLIGDTEMRLTNRILRSASEDMTAEAAVQCTKLMLNAPKWSSFTRIRIDNQKINPSWDLKSIIAETGVLENEYIKLEYCEKKYWSFPLYLRELKSPKINTSIKTVSDLPSLQPLDIKRAREVREYGERYRRDD
ncbi:Hypothetical protein POVR2_LOCUS17 [uncultured virus]|nr:Hypothetical protein POVR2_LOCUS17 [uncultured virus]